MNFDFSDDQKFLKSEARKFLEANSPTTRVRKVLDDEAKPYDEALWKAVAEQDGAEALADDGSRWRLLRAKNKWQAPENCRHHPYPGSYPVVVTDVNDWGGWRVPGAEYDRDPMRIEFQARMIASAPRLLSACRALVRIVDENPGHAPPELVRLAEEVVKIEAYVKSVPTAEEVEADTEVHAAE